MHSPTLCEGNRQFQVENPSLLSYTVVMTKHYYTRREAQALLPEINQKIIELQHARKEIAKRHLQLASLKQKDAIASPEQIFTLEAEIEFIILSARQEIESMHRLSIEVKDISQGLVDFLTLIHHQEAYLCWRQGEEQIAYWHGIEDGYAKRKMLLDEMG